MKKFWKNFVLTALTVSFCTLGAYAQRNFDADFPTDTIYENNQVVYTPSTELWSFSSVAEDKITLTKKISAGSGSYSEFVYSNNAPAFSFGTGLPAPAPCIGAPILKQ